MKKILLIVACAIAAAIAASSCKSVDTCPAYGGTGHVAASVLE